MHSLNLTIHNQENIIEEVLDRIKINSTGDYELVIMVDGCTDRTEEYVDNFIKKNKQIQIKKLTAPNIFETKSNNVVAQNSSGDHIIIIHGDMLINEHGWNERLLKPLFKFKDVFAVSARCSHNWALNPNSKHVIEDFDRDDSWCDILNHTHHANKEMSPDRDIFYIRSCVNRGPLAIDKKVFDFMGGFDECFAPLDMDDHDLCYRAYKELKKICGYYNIDITSDPNWGPTRENNITHGWALKSNHKNTRTVYNRHKDIISSYQPTLERHCI